MNSRKSDNGASTDPKPVTIAIPVYKRLEYLPSVLRIVESQDYPAIELIVSDNGMNGTKVQEIVKTHYSRPFKFRQNPATVELLRHVNQLLREASGAYFLLLCDDDEISSNYVSELVHLLERHPQASAAIARQEIIDKHGALVRKSRETLPQIMSGIDFIRGTWQTYEFQFECFATFLARTNDIRESGGFPEFTRGTGGDNALLIKLCLDSHVVFSPQCAFRWRIDESSYGWSVRMCDLGASTREFLSFLDTDPILNQFAVTHPAVWQELKSALVRNEWITYLWRWRDIYRDRLSAFQWVRAAFAMPFIPAYYRAVAFVLLASAKERAKCLIKGSASSAKPNIWFRG